MCDRKVLLLLWPHRGVNTSPSCLSRCCILLSLVNTAVMKVCWAAHWSPGVNPTYSITPITKTMLHSLHISQARNMGPWRFHIAAPSVESHSAWAQRTCQVLEQKKQNKKQNTDTQVWQIPFVSLHCSLWAGCKTHKETCSSLISAAFGIFPQPWMELSSALFQWSW